MTFDESLSYENSEGLTVWTTLSEDRIKVSDMEEDQLINALHEVRDLREWSSFEEESDLLDTWIDVLKDEYDRRYK